jgi:hypothetical protein
MKLNSDNTLMAKQIIVKINSKPLKSIDIQAFNKACFVHNITFDLFLSNGNFSTF